MSVPQLLTCLTLSAYLFYSSTAQETETPQQVTQPANVPYIETYLIGPFKVWHIGGFVGCGLATILIAICCMIDLRVPRTKEEIEANYEKRQAAHKYIDKLGQMEFTGLQVKSQAALQKERALKKKEIEEKKQQRKAEVQQKKKHQNAAQNGMSGSLSGMPLAYHPGLMQQGMMGYPNPMMMGPQGMYGSSQSLASGQQMPAGMMGGGYPGPGMMYPGMWRAQSLNNLQANSMAQSPALPRAASTTNIQSTDSVEAAASENGDGGNDDGGNAPKRTFAGFVRKMMAEKAEDGEKDKDGKPKPKPIAKRKWGKK